MFEISILDFSDELKEHSHLDDFCVSTESILNKRLEVLSRKDRYITNIRVKANKYGWPARAYIEHRTNRKKTGLNPQVSVIPVDGAGALELEICINNIFHGLQSGGRYVNHWWITYDEACFCACVLIYHTRFIPNL